MSKIEKIVKLVLKIWKNFIVANFGYAKIVLKKI